MAAESSDLTVQGGHKSVATGSLRLDLPERRFEPIHAADYEASSPEASQDGSPLSDDVSTAVGFSISRAQSRLASPQTPSAEKAAAMEGLDGVFDDCLEDEEPDVTQETETPIQGTTQDPQTPPTSPLSMRNLPSPWKASPKTFERPQPQGKGESLVGMLPDVNIRRYMPGLPSLPKVSTFRESVPSLGSILGNARSRSPARKNTLRKQRASTVVNPKSAWVTVVPSGGSSNRASSPPADDLSVIQEDKQHIPLSNDGTSTSEHLGHQTQRPKVVRRSTSDQSLYLRKVTSTAASLGDDSRWDNVSQQVNSRAKAIYDSLQDSSFKRYSISNLPSFSFRPDFLRTRAQSDTKPKPNSDLYAPCNGFPASSRPLPRDRPQCTDKADQRPVLQHPHLDQALAELTGDLVILGGYRGSILRSAKPPHRQYWVPVKVGLNIRKVNLEVGLEPEDEDVMEESIYADGMLSHIGPVDMGRRLLKRIRMCKNVQDGKLRLHEYGYDWRLSPHLLSRRMVTFLENLPSNQPGVSPHENGAAVICHSMGGLITRHAVNKRPDLFSSVVYVGVPQHCVNILGPLRNGDEVLLSSKVLTAQTNFTMRSSYVLLPDDGRCFINRDTGEEYPVNFYSAADWEKHAWSPCIAPADPAPVERKTLLGSISDSLPSFPSLPMPGRNSKPSESQPPLPGDKAVNKLSDLNHMLDPDFHPTTRPIDTNTTIPKAIALAYLTRTLAETLRFRHELAFHPPHSTANTYPPLALIYANNTPTVCAAKVQSKEAIKRADAYDELKFGSGDGVVLAKAAQLPDGYRAVRGGKIKTTRGHVGLLGDLEAVGKALGAVRRGRMEGVGLGHSEADMAHRKLGSEED